MMENDNSNITENTPEQPEAAPETVVQQPNKPKRVSMRVSLFVWLLIIVAGLSAFVGWRVMIRAWPAVKPYLMEYVVYKVAPSLKPEPTYTEIELYTPRSTATLDDEFASTDTVIYYFYKDYCPYCKMISPLFDGIPEVITLTDGTKSALKLVPIEKQYEPGASAIAKYYEDNATPEDRSYVPALVIGDQYFHGGDEIMAGLYNAIYAGEGLDTRMLGNNTRK